ncbi:MAG: hypothetical protein MJY58_05185 [Bacteroidaceae bacterium]|nr:hypothetical protein [Bacteroidaceae bacterium]
MAETKKKGQNGGISAVLVILVLVLGAAAIYFFIDSSRKDKNIEEMTELFELEKEEMENEYSSFAVQYDELQVHLSNDSLIHQLEKEKMRTQQLLEQLRQTQASNAAEIRRLKKELETVRNVMRSYVVQIDSLDRVNKQLEQENTQVRQKYTEASQQVDRLTIEKQQAEEKIALASQLDVSSFRFTTRNKRGKDETKVKNVIKFVLDFTIAKNITTETGEKTAYARILCPNGDPLVKDPSDTFKYQNVTIEYSAKKYIEYTGEQQDVIMYWDIEEYLEAGTYTAFIFVDGVMIGEQNLTLK